MKPATPRGALILRVELVTDPPLDGFVDVRVGSSAKFVPRGAGYAAPAAARLRSRRS
jgi:hypothetical protein